MHQWWAPQSNRIQFEKYFFSPLLLRNTVRNGIVYTAYDMDINDMGRSLSCCITCHTKDQIVSINFMHLRLFSWWNTNKTVYRNKTIECHINLCNAFSLVDSEYAQLHTYNQKSDMHVVCWSGHLWLCSTAIFFFFYSMCLCACV